MKKMTRLRGILFVLLAAVSGGGALVSVLAEEKREEAKPAERAPAQDSTDTAVVAAMLRDQGEGCLVDAAALDDMRIKREELLTKTKWLAEREAELLAKEKALKDEMEKLQLIREEIGLVDAARRKENEERVAKLVETFELMSAKSAAQMLSSLDETLAVSTIGRMSTQKLAKILNVMETGRSSRLAESLAGVVRARRAQAAQAAANAEAVTAKNGKGGEENEHSQKQPSNNDSSTSRSPSSSEAGKAKN
jgi:flagellar motility protein MotE (MotC chaperone)